jgi:hypothetical protein
MPESDMEAGWSHRRLFVRSAAPAAFAVPGLVMIVLAVWQGPSIVRDYQAARLQLEQRMTAAVNDPLADVKEFVGTTTPPGAAELNPGGRTQAGTNSSR